VTQDSNLSGEIKSRSQLAKIWIEKGICMAKTEQSRKLVQTVATGLIELRSIRLGNDLKLFSSRPEWYLQSA